MVLRFFPGAEPQGRRIKSRRVRYLKKFNRIERLFGHTARNPSIADGRHNPAAGPARSWWNGCVRDLWAIAAITFGVYLAASQFDFAERFHEFARTNESYEFDEILIVALAAAVALSWFAVRQCRRLQRELTRRVNLERELIASRSNALELIENKSAFLANLSHEFRTPLNAIHGFADMMRNEIYGPIANQKYVEYVENILHGSTLLIELVNDIIDLEKIDSGQEALAERPCCVHQTIRDILPIVEPVARSGDIRIIDNIPDGLGRIIADPRAVQKIVLNLVTNAVKYNRPGGRVILSAHIDSAGRYVFEVEDTGIGIERTEIEKVLEPFHRGESPFVKSKEGSGLGLNIVNKLLKLHDARLTLRSRPNRGTTATVQFPPERWLGPKHLAAGGDPAEASAA